MFFNKIKVELYNSSDKANKFIFSRNQRPSQCANNQPKKKKNKYAWYVTLYYASEKFELAQSEVY